MNIEPRLAEQPEASIHARMAYSYVVNIRPMRTSTLTPPYHTCLGVVCASWCSGSPYSPQVRPREVLRRTRCRDVCRVLPSRRRRVCVHRHGALHAHGSGGNDAGAAESTPERLTLKVRQRWFTQLSARRFDSQAVQTTPNAIEIKRTTHTCETPTTLIGNREQTSRRALSAESTPSRLVMCFGTYSCAHRRGQHLSPTGPSRTRCAGAARRRRTVLGSARREPVPAGIHHAPAALPRSSDRRGSNIHKHSGCDISTQSASQKR